MEQLKQKEFAKKPDTKTPSSLNYTAGKPNDIELISPQGRVRNQPAVNHTNILALQRTVGNQAVQRMLKQKPKRANVVQRYILPDSKNEEHRVSDNGKIVIKDKKTLYVHDELLVEANKQLSKAGEKGAYVRLMFDGKKGRLKENDDLAAVKPRWTPFRTTPETKADASKFRRNVGEINKLNPKEYKTHADCHLAAQTILGSDDTLMAQGNTERPVVKGKEGGEKMLMPSTEEGTSQKHVANRAVYSFLEFAMPTFAKSLRVDYLATDKVSNHSSKLIGQITEIVDKIESAFISTDPLQQRNRYLNLYRVISQDPLLEPLFGAQFGVNDYITPKIGDALMQANDEREKETADAKKSGDLWNFHWAGVILTDGSDYVTLENLSVEFASVINDLWYFKMYGKGAQSFHSEAKKDTHVGKYPISLLFRTDHKMLKESDEQVAPDKDERKKEAQSIRERKEEEEKKKKLEEETRRKEEYNFNLEKAKSNSSFAPNLLKEAELEVGLAKEEEINASKFLKEVETKVGKEFEKSDDYLVAKKNQEDFGSYAKMLDENNKTISLAPSSLRPVKTFKLKLEKATEKDEMAEKSLETHIKKAKAALGQAEEAAKAIVESTKIHPIFKDKYTELAGKILAEVKQAIQYFEATNYDEATKMLNGVKPQVGEITNEADLERQGAINQERNSLGDFMDDSKPFQEAKMKMLEAASRHKAARNKLEDAKKIMVGVETK